MFLFVSRSKEPSSNMLQVISNWHISTITKAVMKDFFLSRQFQSSNLPSVSYYDSRMAIWVRVNSYYPENNNITALVYAEYSEIILFRSPYPDSFKTSWLPSDFCPMIPGWQYEWMSEWVRIPVSVTPRCWMFRGFQLTPYLSQTVQNHLATFWFPSICSRMTVWVRVNSCYPDNNNFCFFLWSRMCMWESSFY